MNILGRKDEHKIPIDILRLIYNRGLILSLIILIVGHGQIGKSTFQFYLGNRLKQIEQGIPLKKATWKEWDCRKFTSVTPQAFVNLWDNNENEILAMEEAGEQMNYLDWFGVMGRVFSSTTRTQGLKKNKCLMITPHAIDILKHNRECIDFKIWVKIRDDLRRLAVVRPRYIKIDYLKDKYKLGFIRDWAIAYTPEFIVESKKYTDWLKIYKGKIAKKNQNIVDGYNPAKPMSEKNMPPWVREGLYR